MRGSQHQQSLVSSISRHPSRDHGFPYWFLAYRPHQCIHSENFETPHESFYSRELLLILQRRFTVQQVTFYQRTEFPFNHFWEKTRVTRFKRCRVRIQLVTGNDFDIYLCCHLSEFSWTFQSTVVSCSLNFVRVLCSVLVYQTLNKILFFFNTRNFYYV